MLDLAYNVGPFAIWKDICRVYAGQNRIGLLLVGIVVKHWSSLLIWSVRTNKYLVLSLCVHRRIKDCLNIFYLYTLIIKKFLIDFSNLIFDNKIGISNSKYIIYNADFDLSYFSTFSICSYFNCPQHSPHISSTLILR